MFLKQAETLAMKEINSKSNQSYKLFQKLNTRKYREQSGLYLIEGENLIEEAFRNGACIDSLIVRSDCTDKADKMQLDSGKAFIMEKRLFDSLSQTETSQGVMAAVKMQSLSLKDLQERELPGNFVVLDRLQDPGNIGTIIRTADAAGYSLVIAMKGTADIFSPKTVRAAAGSLFRMKIAFANTEEELVRFIKAAGKKLAAACLTGSRNYYDEDLSRDIALIVGNEGNGVAESLIEKAELKIRIPMSGNIESLNVSVAAALIMYEAVRKAR